MKNILDKRSIPVNERVGWVKYSEICDAPFLVEGQVKYICKSYVNLLSEPDGNRVRQLIYGDAFRVLEEREGYAFGFNEFDGYVGYVHSNNLKKRNFKPTHWVSSLSTQIYKSPDIKKEYLVTLPFGSKLEVVNACENFYETIDGGFVPRQHLKKIEEFYSDPVMVAEMFLGIPYLWGGNTPWGIDCSGLIQAAFRGCGIQFPADSDQQEAKSEQVLNHDRFCRNDLIFWDGHVALVIAENKLIHANAFNMSVTSEVIEDTITRIKFEDDNKFRLCRFNIL